MKKDKHSTKKCEEDKEIRIHVFPFFSGRNINICTGMHTSSPQKVNQKLVKMINLQKMGQKGKDLMKEFSE